MADHNQNARKARTFKCSYCDYSSPLRTNVLRHERKHTGEKPFKCSFCDFRSSTRYNCATHEKRHIIEMNVLRDS